MGCSLRRHTAPIPHRNTLRGCVSYVLRTAAHYLRLVSKPDLIFDRALSCFRLFCFLFCFLFRFSFPPVPPSSPLCSFRVCSFLRNLAYSFTQPLVFLVLFSLLTAMEPILSTPPPTVSRQDDNASTAPLSSSPRTASSSANDKTDESFLSSDPADQSLLRHPKGKRKRTAYVPTARRVLVMPLALHLCQLSANVATNTFLLIQGQGQGDPRVRVPSKHQARQDSAPEHCQPGFPQREGGSGMFLDATAHSGTCFK